MSNVLTRPVDPGMVCLLKLPEEVVWDVPLFEAFCRLNPDLVAELDTKGNLIVMPPANAYADNLNFGFNTQLGIWLASHPEFIGFGCSAGFQLSVGSLRSPDASLVRIEDWEALAEEEQHSFPEVPVYFAMELRSSASDSLRIVKEKMAEYMASGVQLAWLIDPVRSELTVYRPDQDPVTVNAPKTFEAGDELPGFEVDFRSIWSPKRK